MYKANDSQKSTFPTTKGPFAAWSIAHTNVKQASLPSAIRGTLPKIPNDLPEKILDNSKTNNKLSNFIEQISQEAETKIFEKQFQNLIEQLQLVALNDENLQQRFKQNLFESFKIFMQHHQTYEEKLTSKLVEQFKKEFGFKLENAIHLSKFQIFQKLSVDHKEVIINKLTDLLTKNMTKQHGVSIEQQRSLSINEVLIDLLLNEYLDLKTLATIENSLTSNVQFSPSNTTPEVPLEHKIMIAVSDFNELVQKNAFLKDYFNKNDADKKFIINYLLLVQEKGNPPKEEKQKVANIIFQAFESNQEIQKAYQEHIKRLEIEWNTTLIADNLEDKKDQAGESDEGDWSDERKFISLDILLTLKTAFIHEQFLKHPQICKILHINNPGNNELKKLEMQQIASSILDRFEYFRKLSKTEKNKLIQNFVDKLNDINKSISVQNTNSTTLKSNIGAIIIQLICEHNIQLNYDLPQEKMILEAINKFKEIVNDKDSPTLSGNNDFKNMKYACINQLLECQKEYTETIGIWPKVIASLLDSQAIKSLQTIGRSLRSTLPTSTQKQLSNTYTAITPQRILETPATLKDLTGVTGVREIESTIKNIKDRISQTIQQIFKDSKETKDQHEKLKLELPFKLISTHDGKLKQALEQQLLELLALQAQKTELSGFVDANPENYLEVFKKELSLAVMLSDIYAFRCLPVDLQLDVIHTLFDYLSKIDTSLPIKENDIRTEALSKIVQKIAMHSNLMSFIENTMELHQEEEPGWWEHFKANISGILGNKRVQGGGTGFIIGTILSKGKISGGIIGAALGATKPTLINKLTESLKKLATPFNYIAKEIIDLYRNPLGHSIANRIMRGSIMVITAILITPIVYVASYIAPLAGSLLGIIGTTAIVAGAVKLTHLISDKIKPLAKFEASKIAQLQWGKETAKEILDYLSNRMTVVKNILQSKQFHSDTAKQFLKDLNNDINNAIILIQEGHVDQFRIKWSDSDGNKNASLREKLYQLANYEHENKLLFNELEKHHLYKFSEELLVNWREKRTDFNIRSMHNNIGVLDFTKSTMQDCNGLLRNLIDINNKITPTIEPEKESANKAKLDELTKLQSPFTDQQLQSQQHNQPTVAKPQLLSFYANAHSIPIPRDDVQPTLVRTKNPKKP